MSQMKRSVRVAIAAVGSLLLAASCNANETASAGGAQVAASAAIDTAAISANSPASSNWLTYGGSYNSNHFSALKKIDTSNVDKLGLAWTYDLNTTHHGVESIPVVVDGVMYVTAPWNAVHALDATTGEQIWSYDPRVPRSVARKGCCDVVNRGVAVYQGKVFEATFDGRLIALDAATGKLVWSTDTLPDGNHNYTITGAPLAANGKVIIGNGGAEYFGARGYVSAYDAQTGELDWRWHTVPGDPDKPYENAAMEKAAKTWDPKTKYWKQGGGGTVWQSFSYDPKLDLLYFGTGNADPWDPNSRGGPKYDSLYTASIVALKLSTGKYVWHYQTTPADMSDYDSDQDLALTSLKIDGESVPVIMNANKNGFFFVLDRRNGKFISAENFTPANWATGYTKEGKPILTGLGQSGKPFETIPGPYAAHNWQAASYSPETGLAYIPAQLIPIVMAPVGNDPESKGKAGGINSGNGWNTGMQLVGGGKTTPFGRLIAWNPVTQKQAWAHDYPAPWNGGTLATAGNLVFQATADGRLVAFNAQNGESRWESSLGQGAIAGPITYSVDGTQYVTIAVGWGGSAGQSFSATDRQGPGTVFTFALGGKATPPEFAKRKTAPLLSGVAYDPKDVAAGTAVYLNNCAICHGTPGQNKGGSVPNLGYVDAAIIKSLGSFVFNGPYVSNGMPDFTDRLTQDDVTKLKAFIQATATAVGKQ